MYIRKELYYATIKNIISIFLAYIIITNAIIPVFSYNINLSPKDEIISKSIQVDPDAFIMAHKKPIATEDEFKNDRVNVVLKHKNSKINKTIKISEFNSNLFSDIEDLSYVEGYDANKKLNTHRVNDEQFHQILSFKLRNPGKENVLKAVEFLNSCDNVLSASPDYIYDFKEDSSIYDTLPPNDPYYSNQWGLAKLNVEDAWEIADTSNIVNIGIFEDGISIHEDIDSNRIIQGNLQYNSGATHNHGTHVAGVLGATTGNGKGIAGVAQVNLICLDDTQFANSLTYAASNDIFIINFSGHYLTSGTDEPAPYNVDHAAAILNYPGLIICAAGNRGNNIDTSPQYPAAYEHDNILTVASTTSSDAKRSDSNYGEESVDLGAPGDEIHYPHPGNTYRTGGGTSIAAPFVTGVAALLKSKYPDMSAETIKYYIENGVDKIGTLEDKVATGGRLNAYKALNGVKTFKVRYDANGGTGTMADTTVIYNNITKLRANQFTYSGAEFAGWCAYRQSDNKWYYTNGSKSKWFVEGTEDDGYEKYVYRNQQTLAKTSSVNNDVITMQAQWNYKITVNFNANTGTGTMQSTTVDLTKSTALPTNGFAKTGYSFDHWYIKNEEGKTFCFKGSNTKWYTIAELPSDYHRKKFSNGATINKNILTGLENGDTITLYAYWEPATATLGDVNRDGLVTVVDANLVRNYLANTVSLSQAQKYIADVDYSNSITIKDASNIEKYVADTLRYFID